MILESNLVLVQKVSKLYRLYRRPADRLREMVPGSGRRHTDFWALRDISFELEKGETLGLVGPNGCGKSTLLQLVSGILQPTTGRIVTRGRIAALLELGAGFNPEFSGRDNVFLNGSILGMSTRQIAERYRDIEAFAEIGDFIDQPVKTYSSGMVVRLAFAVAINVDPEILLVDEALAVGDIYFRQRCMRKVHELRSRGVTILYVTHAVSDVKAIGDRALWLDHGQVVEIGDPDMVVAKYLAAMTEKDTNYRLIHGAHGALAAGSRRGPACAPEIVETIPNIDHRFGDRRAEILGIAVLDDRGAPLQLLEPSSRIVVRISARANEPISNPIVGFMLRNQLGIDFAGTNTAREGYTLSPLEAAEIVTVDFHLELPELYPASFSFSPAIADGDLSAYAMCDWIDNAISLQMSRSEQQIYGYIHLPCRVEINARLRAAVTETVENRLG